MNAALAPTTPSPRIAAALTRALLVVLALLAPAASAQVRLLEAHIWATPSSTLVIPVAFDAPASPHDPWSARLDDGRALPADVYRIVIGPSSTADDSALARWLPPPADWSSLHNDLVRTVPPGFWAIVVQLPADASGAGLWLNQQRFPLTWLDPLPDDPSWADPPDAEAARQAMHSGAERTDPRLLWRRLLILGLLASPDPAESGAFTDPIVRAFADQVTARWRCALARLASLDPALADAVKQRLALTCRMGEGLAIPAWPVDPSRLDALLESLLAPALSDNRRVALARAWLDDQPTALWWIVDDAGLLDPSGTPIGSAAAANLSANPIMAWLDEPLRNPISVAPGKTASIPIRGEPSGDRALTRRLHIGSDFSTDLAIAALPVPLAPPGIAIAQLHADWTLASWLARSDAEPDPSRPIIRLFRIPSRVIPAQAPAEGVITRETVLPASWALLIESAAPPRADEYLRLWIGPRNRPRHIARITPAGVVDDELTPGGIDLWPSHAYADSRGWSVQITLPDSAIDERNRLTIGIEHFAPRRAAWPRRMFPWQSEPARITFDLSAWNPR